MVDNICMHNRDRKYIYFEDTLGVTIGYLANLHLSEDTVMVNIIANKDLLNDGTLAEWDVRDRGIEIAVDLRTKKKWKFYEDYEEFCADFVEAIL